MRKQADKYDGTTVGYKMVDDNGYCKFYIDDGGCGDSKWNVHEGESMMGELVDSFPTLKAAIASVKE